MQTRREMLARSAAVAGLLARRGLLPHGAGGLDAGRLRGQDHGRPVKALGGAAPAESKDVTITGPDIAENGAVVPVGAATALPGVKRLLLLVEKNPRAGGGVRRHRRGGAHISTRVKMGQSSNVYAVAMIADDKVLFAQKEIKVTLGGCGG